MYEDRRKAYRTSVRQLDNYNYGRPQGGKIMGSRRMASHRANSDKMGSNEEEGEENRFALMKIAVIRTDDDDDDHAIGENKS